YCASLTWSDLDDRMRLEAKIEIELYATGRSRRHRQAEKRRALIAHIARVIHPIHHVESAEADFDCRSFIPLLPILPRFQIELLRPAQIECRPARPLQTVAAHADWPVVGDRIVIVIAPAGQAVRTPGIKRNRHPQIEPVSGLECTQYVKAMTLVKISP